MSGIARALLVWFFGVVAGGCEDEPAPSSPLDSSVLVDKRGLSSPLVCPGAVGCKDNEGRLRVGAAALSITPPVGPDDPPVWIAGFGQGRRATGVHDEQWARALVFQQGQSALGLVVLDLVGLFHDEVQRVRQRAREEGLGLDHIVVGTTHVHEAKDTMGLWGEDPTVTGVDPAYQDLLVEQSVAALRAALDDALPVSLRVGQADATGWVRDSRQPFVIDPTVSALDFVDNEGASHATLVIWGNHPETLGEDNTLLTSDYPHFVREEVEARLPGTLAVFAPGLLGGLTTNIGMNLCPDPETGEDACPQGTFERAETVGRQVGQLAAGALLDQPLVEPRLSFRRQGTFLTPNQLPLALAVQIGMIQRSVWDIDGVRVEEDAIGSISIDSVLAGEVRIGSEVSAFSLGDVEVTSIPGELYSELWLAREDGSSFVETPEGRDFPDAKPEPAFSGLGPGAKVRLVMNNSNDAIGYIVPAPQWDVEEPRAYSEEGQYGEQNSLGDRAAPELAAALRRMWQLKP